MTDDIDDVPDKVKAQLEADAFVFGNGFAEKTGDGEYKRIEPTDVTLSVDDDVTLNPPDGERTFQNTEFHGSIEFTIESQDIDCPRCNIENTIPVGDILHLISEGPVNCRLCGYPLL